MDVPRQFVPRSGTGGIAGQLNEVKLVMLFLAKGLESEQVQSFHLGSNVDEASDFDDLVFVYRDKEGKSRALLLQAKHRDNPEKKINLLGTLKKYLNCYIDIKETFSQTEMKDHVLKNMVGVAEFVFFTNASIEDSHQYLIEGKRPKFLNFFPNNTYMIETIPMNVMEDMRIPINFSELVDALIEDYSKQKLYISREIYQKYSSFLNEHVWQIKEEIFSFRHNFLDGSSSHDSAVDLSNAFLHKLAKKRKMNEISVKQELKQSTLKILRKSNSKENQESKRVPITKITLEEINEFFDRFYLFVNQPGEVGLEEIIKDLIKKRFKKLTDAECNIVFNYVCDKILSWWRNVNRSSKIDYITEKNDFFEEGKHLLSWLKVASSLNDTLSKSKIDELCIQFDKCYNIECNVVGIVINNEDERVLHLARLRQTLNSKYGSGPYYYYTVRAELNDCVIESFRASFDLLILDLRGNSQISVKQRTELEQVITLNPKKKIILVGTESVLNKFGMKINMCNIESVGFADLEQKTQEKILNEMEIRFQGRPMTLMDIIPKPWQEHCHLIDSSTLARMIGQECYSIGPKLDYNMDHLIQRSLHRNEVDDACFFDKRLSFAVSNVTMEKFERLRTRAGRSDEEFHLLKDDDDFDSLQVQDNRSLHHLRNDVDSMYVWIKSKSCLDHLRPYVHKGLELDPVEVTGKVFLVVAEPGMGKTMMLSMMANSSKSATWNILLYLNDHSTRLQELKNRPLDTHEALDFLAASMVLDTFGKALLEYGEIDVFLDGFDEICPSHGDTVVNLVKALERSKVSKIWISSRRYMIEELENKLGVFAYPICPFTYDDQETYLRQYWMKILKLKNKRVTDFIYRLLVYFSQVTNSNMPKYPGCHNNPGFLGNPLQLGILAECYNDQLVQFIRQDDDSFAESTFNQVSLFDLYDKIIRTKYFDIWKKEKLASPDVVTAMQEVESAKEYENFEEDHKYLACFTILDDNQLEELLSPKEMRKTKEKIKGINKGNEKRGMINNIIDGKPVFVHRTYAEFFLSKMLTDLLEIDFEATRSFLLNSGFFKQVNTMIRTFFDHSLSRKKPLSKAALTNNTQVIKEIEDPRSLDERDALGRSPLYLASFHGNTEVVGAILDKFNGNIANVDPFDEWTPMTAAAHHARWGATEALMLQGADPHHIDDVDSLRFLMVLWTQTGRLELVRIIFERNPSGDVDYLMGVAVDARQSEMVDYFLGRGADPARALLYDKGMADNITKRLRSALNKKT